MQYGYVFGHVAVFVTVPNYVNMYVRLHTINQHMYVHGNINERIIFHIGHCLEHYLLSNFM